MARLSARPREVLVWYRGIPYILDLVRCRRALVSRQVEGDMDSMESLAHKVGISRSTASRFFSGRATSLAVMLKILEALHLTFDEVARPADDDEGEAEAAIAKRPAPSGRSDGAAAELRSEPAR